MGVSLPGGASLGSGGAGFKLGEAPNVFSAATEAAAIALRDAQESDTAWLTYYNDNIDRNIRLEFVDSGNAKVIFQVRNNAGTDWADNSSAVGVKGDTGIGADISAFTDEDVFPIVDVANQRFIPSRAQQTTGDIRLSGDVNLLDTIENRIKEVATLSKSRESLVGSVTISKTQAGNDFVVLSGSTVPFIELPPTVSDPVEIDDLYDGWYFDVRNETTNNLEVRVNTLNGGSLTGDPAVTPGRSDNRIIFIAPSTFAIQTTAIDAGGSDTTIRGISVPSPTGNNRSLTYVGSGYSWSQILKNEFPVVPVDSPYQSETGQDLAIALNGSDVIIILPENPVARDKVSLSQLVLIGSNKVIFRDDHTNGITLQRADGTQQTDTELWIDQSIQFDFVFGGSRWWVYS